jgi:hypothetical protein
MSNRWLSGCEEYPGHTWIARIDNLEQELSGLLIDICSVSPGVWTFFQTASTQTFQQLGPCDQSLGDATSTSLFGVKAPTYISSHPESGS